MKGEQLREWSRKVLLILNIKGTVKWSNRKCNNHGEGKCKEAEKRTKRQETFCQRNDKIIKIWFCCEENVGRKIERKYEQKDVHKERERDRETWRETNECS